MSSFNGNISVDAIEQQIADAKKNANFKGGRNSFNEKDYLDTKLKPGETEREIRIRLLPATQDSGKLAVEVKTHSLKVSEKVAKSGFKSFICLNDEQTPNYDDNIKCPLCEKSYELFKEAKKLRDNGNKEAADTIYKKASSLLPKVTYITRVIDRAKEDEGVKFWRFNKTTNGDGIFDKLIKLYKNRNENAVKKGNANGYNIFDVNEGRDLIVTITRTFSKDGKEMAPKISVDVDEDKTPLSEDPEQMRKWIEDSKKWYEAYTTRNAHYLELIAEDKVPYRLPDGSYVDAEEVEKTRNQENAIKEEGNREAQEILNDSTLTNEKVSTPPTKNEDAPSNYDDIEDDLPF